MSSPAAGAKHSARESIAVCVSTGVRAGPSGNVGSPAAVAVDPGNGAMVGTGAEVAGAMVGTELTAVSVAARAGALRAGVCSGDSVGVESSSAQEAITHPTMSNVTRKLNCLLCLTALSG
jgi:hypothetical protein